MKGNPKSERRPKTEGRNPKEGRRSKAEGGDDCGCTIYDSGIWSRGDELGEDIMLLRDGDSVGKPPVSDLGERTAKFGEAIIEFAKKIPQNAVNNRLISQLVAAGTSIGANYAEADDAVSGKEFKLRIGTSRKESKETMYFLRMAAKAEPSLASEARVHWREAKELNLIFGAIWRK